MLPEPSVLLFQRNGWPYNFPLHSSANLSCTTQLATTIKYIYRASKSWGSFQPDNWCNKTRHTDEDKKEWIPALREWGPHCRLLGRIQLPHHHMEGAHFLSFSLFSKSRLNSKQFMLKWEKLGVLGDVCLVKWSVGPTRCEKQKQKMSLCL